MEKFELFDTLPEGFRLATEEDLPLINLTIAQAFADYKYPIPSTEISHSALLRLYYELGNTCATNAIKNGCILTNDDFSAVLVIAPFEKRADYGVDSLYQNLINNADIESAENMMKILNYMTQAEESVDVAEGTLFVDIFAVQTPKQGQKLGSKLMRKLFEVCEQKNKDVYLITNTENNKGIYNHFGFETVQAIHKDELNSDTFYLYWKSPKKRLEEEKVNMKVSSMYPIYYCEESNLDKIVDMYKELGFERLHHLKYDDSSKGYVLGNDSGSKIDVISSSNIKAQEGLFGMRINVNNLDEAIKYAKNNDYEILSDVINHKSNRGFFARDSKGMNCYFIEHIKNNTVTTEQMFKEELFDSYWWKSKSFE